MGPVNIEILLQKQKPLAAQQNETDFGQGKQRDSLQTLAS